MPKNDEEVNDSGDAVAVDTSGYVGVDPMYQNYGDITGAPLLGDNDVAYEDAKARDESLAGADYRGVSATATHPSEASDEAVAAKREAAAKAAAKAEKAAASDGGSASTSSSAGSSGSGASASASSGSTPA